MLLLIHFRMLRPLVNSRADPHGDLERLRLNTSYNNGRGRDNGRPLPPSRPGELHPEPLTEPCVNLSIYTARAIH